MASGNSARQAKDIAPPLSYRLQGWCYCCVELRAILRCVMNDCAHLNHVLRLNVRRLFRRDFL